MTTKYEILLSIKQKQYLLRPEIQTKYLCYKNTIRNKTFLKLFIYF